MLPHSQAQPPAAAAGGAAAAGAGGGATQAQQGVAGEGAAAAPLSALGGLMTIEDSYDSHPCMLPLVQLLERAAELSGDTGGAGGGAAGGGGGGREVGLGFGFCWGGVG